MSDVALSEAISIQGSLFFSCLRLVDFLHTQDGLTIHYFFPLLLPSSESQRPFMWLISQVSDMSGFLSFLANGTRRAQKG